jgi:thiamine pyrophosphate-dependent acetolactate synthase large subunit-like protein
MGVGALWTAVHYEIPLLVVVNNNRSFYNDEQHQRRVAQWRDRPVANAWIGMRMADPEVDFTVLARGYGAWADTPITVPDQLAPALRSAIEQVEAGRVALLDVRTAPE